MRKGPSLDLYHALTVAADALSEAWNGAGVASLLAWGDPAEIEVPYCRGLHEDVCHGLSTAAGRRIVDALRRRGEPVVLRADKLRKDAKELRAALDNGGIEGLLLIPVTAGSGVAGVVCLQLSETEVASVEAHDALRLAVVDQIGRSLRGLPLAASAASLAVAMAEDHQGDPSPIGGVVVLDRWERVIFSFGIPEQLPGWSRLGPFGRPVDGLPGGALLAGLDLSQPGDLTWEEHLFPPMEDHGIPVSVSAVPFAQRGDDETGRIVLLRDLRSETDDDGAPLLELALRVASEREAAEGLLEGLDAGPEGPMARRFDAYRKALLQQTGDVPRLIRDAVRRTLGDQSQLRTNLNALLERVLGAREREFLAEGLRVLRFLRPELTDVPGDPVELQRIVTGLVEQSRDSLRPAGGTLTVRTWEEAGEVFLAVSDDGRGVAHGEALEAFQPLYTEVDPGSGVERFLDEARSVVEPWEGRLMVESRPGLWNRFTLMLPGARKAAEAPTDLPPAVQVQKGSEGLEVLVVDDNPSLRSVVRRFLEKRGHAVTEAEDGERALELLGDRIFDRVVVDVRMPGTDGPTFFRTLDSVAPQMQDRTIFMTGGFLERDIESFIVSTGRPAIQKPFDLREMAETVEA